MQDKITLAKIILILFPVSDKDIIRFASWIEYHFPFYSRTAPTALPRLDVDKANPDAEDNTKNVSESHARESQELESEGEKTMGVQFLEIPKGDDMHIKDLGFDQEYLLFEAFSKLMAYLQPSGFPSGNKASCDFYSNGSIWIFSTGILN